MSFDCPQILRFPEVHKAPRSHAVIVTSYRTGATEGRNVGVPGYSYDFVLQLFAPLIQQWGELIVIPRDEVDHAVKEARTRGLEPIHLSFLPLHDVRLANDAPNVVVPAWEYPDIPDHEFDNKPENNWVEMAARCDMLLVGGPFTADAFRRTKIRTPIRIVQVPTPDEYFHVPPWDPGQHRSLNCPHHTCSYPDRMPIVAVGPVVPSAYPSSTWRRKVVRLLHNIVRPVYRCGLRQIVSERLHFAVKTAVDHGLCAWRDPQVSWPPKLPKSTESRLNLSGVVYVSIFNPIDYRKNWQDLLTGFLWALGDCEDATLVLKLITNQPRMVEDVQTFYRRVNIPHRCRVVFIPDFLRDEQLIELAGAATYYLSTTRAEGNCLPLLNYLAAGRPGISPCHTAVADYFGRDVGFVVESHAEPRCLPTRQPTPREHHVAAGGMDVASGADSAELRGDQTRSINVSQTCPQRPREDAQME